jgi:hypothetical protein
MKRRIHSFVPVTVVAVALWASGSLFFPPRAAAQQGQNAVYNGTSPVPSPSFCRRTHWSRLLMLCPSRNRLHGSSDLHRLNGEAPRSQTIAVACRFQFAASKMMGFTPIATGRPGDIVAELPSRSL